MSVEEVANHELAAAQTYLVRVYNEGEIVDQDYEEAARLYRLVVEQGDAEAIWRIALMYKGGCGAPPDINKAVSLRRKSAENGNGDGQYYLGLIFEVGVGVEVDLEDAASLYALAAEQRMATVGSVNSPSILHLRLSDSPFPQGGSQVVATLLSHNGTSKWSRRTPLSRGGRKRGRVALRAKQLFCSQSLPHFAIPSGFNQTFTTLAA